MLIKVDDAIPGGIYLDKETSTYADSNDIINLAILNEDSDTLTLTADVIARLLKLNDSETEVYKVLLNIIKETGRNQSLITHVIDKAIEHYGKTMRAYYKAIKGLIEKRVVSSCGVDYIKININYNFSDKFNTEPKFIVIRLTDNR